MWHVWPDAPEVPGYITVRASCRTVPHVQAAVAALHAAARSTQRTRTIRRPLVVSVSLITRLQTDCRTPSAAAASSTQLLSKSSPSKSQRKSLPPQTNSVSSDPPAQTSLLSLSAPGGFGPTQNNVIIGVLTGLETLIQIRGEGRTVAKATPPLCAQRPNTVWALRRSPSHTLT